jgi:CMP-N,N'-diacetyllegionaminic acid synthase
MSIVGVIPARGGSTAVPKKSIALCAERPLLAYTCEAALGSKGLSRTILSTDDPEIAAVGVSCGVDVPFLRPPELATAEAPMVPVLAHALDWLDSSGIAVEALVLLQPTSPLRTSRHIDEAIELWRTRVAETVVSVVEVPHQFGPGSLLKLRDGRVEPFFPDQPRHVRRQDKPRVYARNGPAVLVVSPAVIRRGDLYGDPTLGYVMPRSSSHDVDDREDLELVDLILTHRAEG